MLAEGDAVLVFGGVVGVLLHDVGDLDELGVPVVGLDFGVVVLLVEVADVEHAVEGHPDELLEGMEGGVGYHGGVEFLVAHVEAEAEEEVDGGGEGLEGLLGVAVGVEEAGVEVDEALLEAVAVVHVAGVVLGDRARE